MPSSPPLSPSMRRRGWARKCERYCCNIFTYFPLAFIYGVTTWAAWVEAGIGTLPSKSWTGHASSAIGVALYILLNWSYTTAVFTDPGTPLETKGGYSHLPTQESRPYTSFTVKSNGTLRFCKKCQTKKPDRAHHCSTCNRCVLKMDHHCPWLAACVGLRNYKAFLLFLIYLTLFCWICFAVSATWVYNELFTQGQYSDSIMPVNNILLAVISGIIGLVITGFTSWHIWLACTGQTTIESLEKTRYLSPLRKSMQQQLSRRNYLDANNARPSIGEQIREIHANALPGVTRPEEGEDSRSNTPLAPMASPAHASLHRSYYADLEHQREHDRYARYLEERDAQSLPNAFDLGWRRNLIHVLGPSMLLWFIPVPTTVGDGWQWEASEKWIEAREGIRRERDAQKELERQAGWGGDSPTEASFPNSSGPKMSKPAWRIGSEEDGDSRYLTTSNGVLRTPTEGRRSPGKADLILGRNPGMYSDGTEVGTPLATLDRKKFDTRVGHHIDNIDVDIDDDDDDEDYDESSDEEAAMDSKKPLMKGIQHPPKRAVGNKTPSSLPSKAAQNWNDVPDEFFATATKTPVHGNNKKTQANASNRDEAEWTQWGPNEEPSKKD